MEVLKSPNVLQFLGGLACVLLGSLVPGVEPGAATALVIAGVAAMSNAIKSPGDLMSARAEKARASAPPAGKP